MLTGLIDDKSALVRVMVGVAMQNANTWTDVDPDLCRHVVSHG